MVMALPRRLAILRSESPATRLHPALQASAKSQKPLNRLRRTAHGCYRTLECRTAPDQAFNPTQVCLTQSSNACAGFVSFISLFGRPAARLTSVVRYAAPRPTNHCVMKADKGV
jgi:hypothetical protein